MNHDFKGETIFLNLAAKEKIFAFYEVKVYS